MKKLILASILSVLMLVPASFVIAGGGDSFAGGLAGGMVGGVISGAMTKDNSGRRAESKVEQLQRERDQERLAQLKDEVVRTKADTSFNLLLIFMGLMFVAIIFMAVMLIKMRKK